jgi:hypothetical protein
MGVSSSAALGVIEKTEAHGSLQCAESFDVSIY